MICAVPFAKNSFQTRSRQNVCPVKFAIVESISDKTDQVSKIQTIKTLCTDFVQGVFSVRRKNFKKAAYCQS